MTPPFNWYTVLVFCFEYYKFPKFTGSWIDWIQGGGLNEENTGMLSLLRSMFILINNKVHIWIDCVCRNLNIQQEPNLGLGRFFSPLNKK